jgi:hypothetical protein
MMFVLRLKSIILETIISFEEKQNGLYDMQLSVTAMFHVWKNRFIVSHDFVAKYAMWLTIFINRFKHGHNVFRGNIWHDIVDGVKHKSASWSQNLNVAANIFLDLLGRPAI